jgi:hypothetical protein
MSEITYVFAKASEDLSNYIYGIWEGRSQLRDFNKMVDLFSRTYKAYYGMSWDSNYSIGEAGEQGEFSTIQINEMRSHIKNVLGMTTQNKIVFDCLSTSTDVKAQNDVMIAQSLLEQMFYVHRLEKKAKSALEMGLVWGTGYLFCGWKPGNELAGIDENGEPVFRGEIEVKPLTYLDVFVDRTIEQWDEHQYVIIRRLENRYELIARFPEAKEKILALKVPSNITTGQNRNPEEYANVWVYHAYHKPCRALPQGRMTICVDDGVTLYDDINPYECLPVLCLRPDMRYGSAYGHALAWDLMPLQEASNTLDSSFLTMAENFAIPNILASDKFQIIESDISGGMKLVQGQPDPDAPNNGFPMAMQMPEPAQIYLQMREKYSANMSAISGMNESVRGIVQTNQSGTAIALATTAAQVYNSNVENAYISFLEEFASMILRISRMFMTTEEIINLAGLTMDFQVATFQQATLQEIASVRVNLGNPLAKSISGRVEIANQLLNQGLLKPYEYLNILSTGDLKTKIDKKGSQDTLIKLENEMLVQGEDVVINILDHHLNHIADHRTLLDNPRVRKSSELVALIMEHVTEHITQMEVLKRDNPDLLDVALEQPVGTTRQMMMQAQPMQPQQPAQPGVEMPAPKASQSADAAQEGPEAAAESAMNRSESLQASANEQMGAE